jgi:glycosyltransferase involved in cell wall biosynthesis
VVRSAEAVIAICPALVETVRAIDPGARVTLIENTAESHAVDGVASSAVERLRAGLELGNKRAVLYIGTFEAYQGLDILLEAGAALAGRRDDLALVFVGGEKSQVEALRAKASRLGIGNLCRFTGQVPHHEVPPYLRLADVLVSPRSAGTNTPLKIYSYLRSGAPIVATDLPTHTQVLTKDVALLVPPQAEAMAGAIAKLLDNSELRGRLAQAAMRLSDERYSYELYVEKTKRVYEEIESLRHG